MVETKSSKLEKDKLLKVSKNKPDKELFNKDNQSSIYTDFVDRAKALNLEVVSKDGEDKFIYLCQTLIDKLESIDVDLSPLAEIIDADIRVKNLLIALYEGKSFEQALSVEGVDVDLFDRTEQVDISNSLKCADNFCTSHKLQDYEIESFVEYVRSVTPLMIKGEISEELLEQLWRSYAFENEISQALLAGIARGKNMKIDHIRSERENNDGMGSSLAGAIMGKPSRNENGYIEKILRNRL